MSSSYATPLLLDLKFSPYFNYFLLLINLLCITGIVLMPLAGIFQLLLFVLVLAASYFSYQKQMQYQTLIWQQENDWLIKTGQTEINARLLPDSFVTSWLAVLNFRSQSGRRISVVIFSDGIDKQVFRKLRVRLKVEGNKTLVHDKIIK